jgi:site-specific DNA-methyltransferase (adenine-specific)
MKIEYRKLKDIAPYGDNPRRNDSAVDAVAASIRDFGFLVPIVVDDGGVIVTGHTRLKAAERLGLAAVPVIRAAELTPEQAQAFRLADNKTGGIAAWDMGKLLAELDRLEGFDMREYGFTDTDFEAVVDAEDDGYDGEAPKQPITKTGELWALGCHRLLVGDARSGKGVGRLTGGRPMDLWLTDPPYGVDIGDKNRRLNATDRSSRVASDIEGDAISPEGLYALLQESFAQAAQVLKRGGAFYIWHADANRRTFDKALAAVGLTPRQTLIWVKNNITLTRQDYQWRHEPCLYGWRGGAAHYFTFDRTQQGVFDDLSDTRRVGKKDLVRLVKDLHNKLGSTVMYEDSPLKSPEHAAAKPVPLMGRLISNSSRRGEAVLDTFAGSGSTLIAAQQLGRQAYVMEIDPKRADVIIARYEALTGTLAERLEG